MSFDLTKAFNEFAERAVADYPRLAGRFSIYSAPTETVHGSFPDDAVPHLIYMQKSQVDDFKKKHRERPHGFAQEAEGYFLINYIAEGMEHRNYIIAGDPYQREFAAAMEHELAHLVAPGAEARFIGNRPPPFKECVAEAFTFLRQAQQFGPIRDQAVRDEYLQASHLLLRQDRSHFSVPVINEVVRMAETHDLSKLTPDETAHMAFRISLLYAPTSPDLYKLEAAFRPVTESFIKENGAWQASLFDACAEVLMRPQEDIPDLILSTGRAFLGPFVNGRVDIIPPELFTGKELNAMFAGPFWDRVRDRINSSPEKSADRFKQEARDMMVFGYFDKSPDDVKWPAPYGAKNNMDYLERAQTVFAEARHLQETGSLSPESEVALESADVEGLDRDALIMLAKRIAAHPPQRNVSSKQNSNKPSPRQP